MLHRVAQPHLSGVKPDLEPHLGSSLSPLPQLHSLASSFWFRAGASLVGLIISGFLPEYFSSHEARPSLHSIFFFPNVNYKIGQCCLHILFDPYSNQSRWDHSCYFYPCFLEEESKE